MNSLLRSEMSSRGSLFSQYQWSKNNTASFSAVSLDEVGMIQISEFNLSVIVKMQSKPSSTGKGPMKSKATESQCSSGTGNGCRGPAGLEVDDLLR